MFVFSSIKACPSPAPFEKEGLPEKEDLPGAEKEAQDKGKGKTKPKVKGKGKSDLDKPREVSADLAQIIGHSGGERSLGETKYIIGDSYTVEKVWASAFVIN